MQYVNQQTFDYLQNPESLHCIVVLTTHVREQCSDTMFPVSLIYDTQEPK